MEVNQLEHLSVRAVPAVHRTQAAMRLMGFLRSYARGLWQPTIHLPPFVVGIMYVEYHQPGPNSALIS